MKTPDDPGERDPPLALERFTVRHARSTARGTETRINNRSVKSSPFLKGPIPLPWLVVAGGLPGKALLVAVGIWYLAGLGKRMTVKTTGRLWRELRLTRQAGYRGIKALEKAGLIAVERLPGRATVVTLQRNVVNAMFQTHQSPDLRKEE